MVLKTFEESQVAFSDYLEDSKELQSRSTLPRKRSNKKFLEEFDSLTDEELEIVRKNLSKIT